MKRPDTEKRVVRAAMRYYETWRTGFAMRARIEHSKGFIAETALLEACAAHAEKRKRK